MSGLKAMGGNHKLSVLKEVQLFSTLTDKELRQISDKVSVRNFKKNETILYEEDTNEFMYIILSGNVKALQITEEGKETILAVHRAGDFFGEMALIDGKTTPASVVATEDSRIALVSKRDFYSLLFSQNKVLEMLLRILSSRLRESWEKIRMMTHKDASVRIKTLFRMLATEYGEKTAEGVTLNIKLTHQTIASMTSLTRETVTRVLDRWQEDGKITVLKNKFIRLGPGFLQDT